MSRVSKTAHDIDIKWRSQDVQQKEKADFSTLLLKERVLAGLKKAGYKTPSPIQAIAIPPGIFGKDLLVQAKSGTGKTLVFTVIALQNLLEIKYPQVLIMVPTREIAVQVRDCVRTVGCKIKGLKCCSFIGGLPVSEDEENVVDCQIIVGTPGRLKQLISIGFLKTNSIRLLVLDEADTLLESAFINELNFIFQSLPKAKQVIATSATYPKELKTFIRHYFRMNVFKAQLNKAEYALLGMVHYIKTVPWSKLPLVAYNQKLTALEFILSTVLFTQCLVFCNLKSIVESLCCDVRSWGFTATYISADKEQHARLKAIDNLKRFRCKVLVTSDVTARGIDAENVDLVVNFDKPYKEEIYFHRCGRAGRYGTKGVAITLISEDEVPDFKASIENKTFQLYVLPDPLPKNLINMRPNEGKLNGDSSDCEEQEAVVANGTIQEGSKVASNKENIVHISKISLTSATENENKKCGKSKDVSLKKDGSEKSGNSTLNGPSNDSEQVGKDITVLSCVESSEDEVNELHLKSIDKECIVENVVNKDILETKADEGSCLLIEESTAKDFDQQKDTGVIKEVCQDNLSELPFNTFNDSETLNIVEQAKEKDGFETDLKPKFNEKLEESGFERDLESLQIVDEINNSCKTVTESAQVEPVKVAHLTDLQKSLAKFLIDYEAKSDQHNLDNVHQLEVLGNSPSSRKEKQNLQKCDVTAEKFQNIRKGLTDFYHKIYKAYQAQSIDEASFKNFEATVMAQDVNKNETSGINRGAILDEHSYAKSPKLEAKSDGKKVTERLLNKEIDTDSDSSDSSDSTSSENNLQSSLNAGDQTLANYIFKGCISKNSSKESSKKQFSDILNKHSNASDNTSSSSESEESFCSSSWKLQSKVVQVPKKGPKSSHQNKNPSKTLLKQVGDNSKNRQSIKKNPKNEYDHQLNSKRGKAPLFVNGVSEESSDSDSDRHIKSSSNDEDDLATYKELMNNSSEPANAFASSSRKLLSSVVKVPNKCPPKPSHQNKNKKYDVPSTSKNSQGARKKVLPPKSNFARNEYSCQPNGQNPPFSHLHNGKKSKTKETFHSNALPSRSNASYQQGFNKSSHISKSQEHKDFESKTYENSRSGSYGASYPYNQQHYDYFPTSVPFSQVPVSQAVYSNHQCSCCIGNISSNNNTTPGDLYDIFLRQWHFIQNFSYPN